MIQTRKNLNKSYRLFCENKILDFVESIEISSKDVVGLYYPLNDEFDVKPLINYFVNKEIMVSLPITNKDKSDKILTFRLFKTKEDLVKGNYGILEPKDNLKEVIPNVIFVPLLAFDEKGNRLGYGGGYYDSTISFYRKNKKNVLKIVGIGYSAQKIEEVPVEDFDEILDGILTETGYLRIDK